VLTRLKLEPAGCTFDPDSLVPGRLPDVFPGCPVLILGRYRGLPDGGVALQAADAASQPWSVVVHATRSDSPALSAVWARGQVRKLEDRYLTGGDRADLERRVVETSLRFGVLSRFTAFVAVDRSEVVNPGGQVREIVQPVEMPEGWGEALITGALGAMPLTGVPSSVVSCSALECAEDLCRMEGPPPSASRRAKARRSYFGKQPSWLSRLLNWFFGRRQHVQDPASSPVTDLEACRKKTQELLRILETTLTKDHVSRRSVLVQVAEQLEELLRGLFRLNILTTEVQRLGELMLKLQPIRGNTGASPDEIEQLWNEAEAALRAFLNGGGTAAPEERREGFWK